MLGHSRMTLEYAPTTLNEIINFLENQPHQSYMGQGNVARIFSEYINRDIRVNRRPYRIHNSDLIIQIQYLGPFMEEEESYLPEGGRFLYWKISPLELKTEFSDGNNQYLTFSKKRC
jgi:hypothetical protein